MEKTILIILDGWGIGDKTKSDAIFSGETNYIDNLLKNYPNSKLMASGKHVGLPDGQMGNSEVGHLNIGAGRLVFQDLVKINQEIENNKIAENKILKDAFYYAEKNQKSLHFIGLLSDGGVHSLDKHLYKLCDLTKDYNLEKIFIHIITDGRDCDPKSSYNFVKNLQSYIKNSNVQIASLIGRYYAMDRDNRWERIKIAYDLMVKGKGKKTNDLLKEIKNSYENGITDEFIKAKIIVDEKNNSIGKIEKDDLVICFNFRTDRLREITRALTQKNFEEFDMKTLKLKYLTLTNYNKNFKNVEVIYDKENLKNTIGEVLAKNGKKQIRIAETEKYSHVTFFFSGGREEKFENEKRILIDSPKVATYDLDPEMSAYKVKNAIIKELEKNEVDFICLNFANADMVGHTGIYNSILKALKTVDNCVKEVVEVAKKNNYNIMIISDHGNSDFTINKNGSPNTAHTLNPVPCILISENYKKIKDGKLSDVAPTLLKIMNLKIPKEMTGKVLF